MRRPLSLILAATVLLVSGAAGAAVQAVLRPPLAFQGDTHALVVFRGAGLDATCRRLGGRTRPDRVIVACAPVIAGRRAIYAPNPCLHDESYARLLCHELAHVNGWPGDHPGARP